MILGRQANGAAGEELEYDSLIVAAGSSHAYFGHDEWAAGRARAEVDRGRARIRRRILSAFEAAELEPDPERRARAG